MSTRCSGYACVQLGGPASVFPSRRCVGRCSTPLQIGDEHVRTRALPTPHSPRFSRMPPTAYLRTSYTVPEPLVASGKALQHRSILGGQRTSRIHQTHTPTRPCSSVVPWCSCLVSTSRTPFTGAAYNQPGIRHRGGVLLRPCPTESDALGVPRRPEGVDP